MNKLLINDYKKHLGSLVTIALILTAGNIYDALVKCFLHSEHSRLVFSRGLLILVGVILLIKAILNRQRINSLINEFFLAQSHPINLAFFRIVFFGYLISLMQVPYQLTAWFSQWPKELIFAPYGMNWAVKFLPFSETMTTLLVNLYYFFCFAAFIGFCARFAAFMVGILGIYVIGFPGFFGFAYHYHHLIWFSFILAASRCSDFLSVDSVIRAWKQAGKGRIISPKPEQCYALPLRFIWLLIGIIYFFPGFWKIWNVGLDWALSDNFKYLMNFHLSLKGWVMPFGIDRLPFIYETGALLTIVFEMAFIFLIFNSSYRYWAVVAGLIFHIVVDRSLGITFMKLYICYSSFLNWRCIFYRMGKLLYRKQGQILYNAESKKHCRLIAILQVIDILGHFDSIKSYDQELLSKGNIVHFPNFPAREEFVYIIGPNTYYGFKAIMKIALKVPVLWCAAPFLYFWSAANLSKHMADYSPNKIDEQAEGVSLDLFSEGQALRKNGFLMVTFILILAGSVFYGSARITQGWPFACYPHFAYLFYPGTIRYELKIIQENSHNKSVIVSQENIMNKTHNLRYNQLIKKIFNTQDEKSRTRRFQALWEVFVKNDPSLSDAKVISFYIGERIMDTEGKFGEAKYGLPICVLKF